MHLLRNSLVVGVTLLGLGCASSPVPVEQLASAEASVRAARELGAAKVPRAELHLNLAQTQVTQARKLSEDGENEQASVLLTRARADAELAVSLVREAAVYQDLEATGAAKSDTSLNHTTTSPALGGMR
jgi:hypothetical protein